MSDKSRNGSCVLSPSEIASVEQVIADRGITTAAHVLGITHVALRVARVGGEIRPATRQTILAKLEAVGELASLRAENKALRAALVQLNAKEVA